MFSCTASNCVPLKAFGCEVTRTTEDPPHQVTEIESGVPLICPVWWANYVLTCLLAVLSECTARISQQTKDGTAKQQRLFLGGRHISQKKINLSPNLNPLTWFFWGNLYTLVFIFWQYHEENGKSLLETKLHVPQLKLLESNFVLLILNNLFAFILKKKEITQECVQFERFYLNNQKPVSKVRKIVSPQALFLCFAKILFC